MTKTQRLLISVPLTIAAIAFAGCGGSGSSSSTAGPGGATSPADATSAATGDIPDNQMFLTFRDSKAGYSISYPEGWTQKGNANDVTFSDKGNTVHVSVAAGPPATAATVNADLAQLSKTDQTVNSGTPATVSLKNGRAIKVTYTLLGAPDPVTAQRPTLTVDRYVYSRNGKVATVDLGTVKGVDNVDAYRLISNSFSWN